MKRAKTVRWKWTKKRRDRFFEILINMEIKNRIIQMRERGFQTTHGEARVKNGKIEITVW